MNYSAKKLVAENLENWFTVDHILFGGIPKSYMPKTVYENYLQLKKTYLSSLYEMYNFVGYQSKYIECPSNRVEIEKNALKSINEARKLSAKVLIKESKKFGKLLKESKKEDINDNVKRIKLSSLFESAFMTSQLANAKRPNNFESPKFLLLRNCLTECKKELIALSLKYFKTK